MDYKKCTREEHDMGASIMMMFAIVKYPAKRIPEFLRALAESFEVSMKEREAEGDGPCSCFVCISERQAQAAKFN